MANYQFSEENEKIIINARNKHFVVHALSEEMIFLESFLRQQEKQIVEYCENFDKHVGVEEIDKEYWDGYNEPEIVTFPVRHVDGILETDYDLKGIFTEILPTYQRQAILVSLWSRFESKMADIIDHIHSERGSKQKAKRKNDSVFKHQISEFCSFGLSFEEENLQSSIYTLDNEVRIIRNCWVHDGGKPNKEQIFSLINQTKFLSITNGLVDISFEYLQGVANNMSLLANHIYHEIGIKRKC